MDHELVEDLPVVVNGFHFGTMNTTLVDCLLCEFSWNFRTTAVSEGMESKFERFGYRPPVYVRIMKLNPTHLAIVMERINDDEFDPHDDGFCLEFIVTLFNYKGTLKRRFMSLEHATISIYVNYDDLGDSENDVRTWILKCAVKMHEFTPLENEARRSQERKIEEIAQNVENQKNLPDMAYLLGRDSLTNIFSGRQDERYAHVKSGLIARTLVLADMIAEKKRAKEMGGEEHDTAISMHVCLHYILYGFLRPISKQDLAELYLIAYNYGLGYLADECRYCILDILCNCGDIDNAFLIHVIMHADMVCDLKLLHKLMEIFIENKNDVMQSQAWKDISELSRLFILNFLDVSVRKLNGLLEDDEENFGQSPQPSETNADSSRKL